jgi:hypothetical protein
MGELRPGAFTRIFAEVQREGQLKSRRVLTQLALGRRTPSQDQRLGWCPQAGHEDPGEPGSRAGRHLRHIAALAHPLAGRLHRGGWETKVGTAVGFTPPYGRTRANKYGLFLETGLKNGATYPFLKPAFDFGVRVVAPQLYQSVFRPGWPHF